MQTTSKTTVTSTFSSSEAVECAFDADGTAHLMGILSNMYRDAPLAVLREYSANALDAHIRAGNPAPIAVDLPTDWNPVLTVTDHGVGLSEEEIITVYSRYGKSTKRDSDDYVGAFGIGAKSAFTIATQFTVTGVKDGRKTIALFALNEAGVGTVDIKVRTATDDPNGVVVEVAVNEVAAMRQAAPRLFGTWEPGTVLVDGTAPAYLPDSMLQVTGNIYAHYQRGVDPRESPTVVTVVMGGIPYPASPAMLRLAARRSDNGEARRVLENLAANRTGLRLMAFAPIGDVDITPSREDLRDTPRTIAALAEIVKVYLANLDATIARVIDAAPSPMHVVAQMNLLLGFLSAPWKGITWRGRLLPGTITLPYPVIRLEKAGQGRRTRCYPAAEFHLGQNFDQTLVITDVDVAGAKSVRRLANRYMTRHGLTTLVLVPDAEGAVFWFAYGGASPLTTKTFSEFKTQASALPTVTVRREARYVVVINGDRSVLSSSELTAKAASSRLLLAGHDYHREVLAGALCPTDVLVRLTGGQTEAVFRRRFPGATDAVAVLREHAQRVLDAATPLERLALNHLPDHRFDRIARQPALCSLAPVRSLIEPYQAGVAACEAVNENRLVYLRQAEAELGIEHAANKLVTGLPLLDLTLRFAEYAKFDPAMRDHLARYVEVSTHDDYAAVA